MKKGLKSALTGRYFETDFVDTATETKFYTNKLKNDDIDTNNINDDIDNKSYSIGAIMRNDNTSLAGGKKNRFLMSLVHYQN